MLQQTQVATVVPYFERFLTVFPTVAALAAADEQAVLRQWEGLGYYRRARDLHRAARQLTTAYPDALPDDPAVWRDLPGVGRYMLGAILSQAFERRLPILEANSQRVLCRYFGITDDPRRSPTRRRLWELAEAILPPRRFGAFNQALMELGALVCVPASPRCDGCPLAGECVARQRGCQDAIPPRPTPPKIVEVNEMALVVRRGRRVFLGQRPAEGRWAGLWEFPHAEWVSGETPAEAAVRLAGELLGLAVEPGVELGTIRHGVTRYRITMRCFDARCRSGRFRSSFYPRGRWVEPETLDVFPLSAPQRRLARLLRGGFPSRLF